MTDVSRGFESVTRVDDARARLFDTVEPMDRTDEIALSRAVGCVLAEPVRSDRNVPHYQRAAMDGWAVRSTDTFGAGARSPTILRESSAIGPNKAVRVHTGSVLPSGADAVVMVEQTEQHGEDVEVFDAVAKEENIAPIGEDVEEGQLLYEPGRQIRPSDLGLLKSIGRSTVAVYERPTVGVIPTGGELVQSDPEPGEVIETNGLTVAQYVERWGGIPTYRDVVTDDYEALRAAIERDLTKDIVVTTGGSSVGERDLIPEVVEDLGELIVHGVALKPGYPCAFGIVQEIPVVMLPGYPVSCIVNAVQFLRPLLMRVGNRPCDPHPTTDARLRRKIRSEPGVRTYVRVTLDRSEETPVATPIRANGSGALSSVTLADGWVVVREGREGIPKDETVLVENWEAYP